ncbi:DNA repair protein RAD16 [Kickxella alabastrina]|nr:DNA repair protein RAD16 [Kickxella alabastrina]
MVELQQAALDCVAAMISELCSSAKVLDSAEINVEASLFRYFDAMVKRQLAPYWHRLSGRVRGMVADLASLRRVAELITAYDCVSLQRYLDTLLISNKPGPGSSSAPATWLASDSANILFAVARARLFHRVPADQVPEETKVRLRDLGLPENIAPVLEVPPKLQLLAQILDEIGAINHGASKQGKDAGPVLIMAGSSRECRLIRSYLVTLNDIVRLDVPGKEGSGSEHPRMMVNLLRGFFRWKAQMARPEKPAVTGFSAQAQARSTPQTARPAQPHSNNGQGAGQLRRLAPPTKRRRTRGASTASSGVLRAPADELEQESAELAATINSRDAAADNGNSSGGDLLGFGMHESQAAQDPAAVEPGSEYLDDDADEWAETLGAFDENFGILPGSETLIVQSYSDSLGRLEALRPTHIVMYDPDPAFIREIELYQAHGGPLKQVYFMVYDNSIEEQRYLSSIRREREAFEKMIRDKATMVIPIGANAVPGISALVGGGSPGSTLLRAIVNRSHRDASTSEEDSVRKPIVVVDVREFRSPLPSFLHAAGFDVVPRTIDIGDYILHDNLVVERKSLPDLIGSLRSGRLYNQAEAMTNHYTYAALLIEFEVNTSFSLQAMGGLTADIQFGSINSQLTMLVLAFPRLRILWSCSPYETVNIFVELKRNSQEPDIDRAVMMGQDDSAVERESIYSQSAITLLQSLPGVTLRNYQALAKKYKNIREMCAAKKEDLDQLLDNESAKQLYQFLHANATTQ